MSALYVEVWTLRRGIIDPPEPVGPSVQQHLDQEDRLNEWRNKEVQAERDKPLTRREMQS